jgi:hypothetical protein
MSSKKQMYRSDRVTLKPRSRKGVAQLPVQQQVSSRIGADPRTMIRRDLLQLQHTIGNRALGQMLVQRTPDEYEHMTTTGGKIEVSVGGSLIEAKGWIGQMVEPTGLFSQWRSPSLEKTALKASVDFHQDETNDKRLVIGTISSQPKRTGVGTILIFHLAKYALENGYTTIGTELSALEEGTPQFYESIGLKPGQERYDMLIETGIPLDSPKAKDILWSGSLDGNVEDVFNIAIEKMTKSPWVKT